MCVAQPAAGANWGAVYTPRIGTEVAIGFLDGDIDRPVVLGQLYNGAYTPPSAPVWTPASTTLA